MDKDPFQEFDEQPDDLFDDELFEAETPKKPVLSYMLVGFFVPLIGFIMYVVYKKDKHQEANAFLDGAIIGIFTFIILSLLVIGYIKYA